MARPGILNTEERYGVIAQLLHWATAILILILLPLGKYMEGLPFSTDAEIAHKVWFYSLHKTLGMTVFCIAIIRVIWAFLSKHPEPLHPESKLETFAAAVAHWVLYICIILVPFVGYLHHATSVGFAPIWGPFPQTLPFIPQGLELADLTGKLHFILAAIMGLTILAHIGGALKHAIFERDGTLSRMIPFKDVTLSGFVNFGRTGHRVPYSQGMAPRICAFVIIFGAIAAVTTLSILPTQMAQESEAQVTETQVTETKVENAAPAATTEKSAEAASGKWIVDHDNSELSITITQMGSPVSGGFADWNADIVFDPEDLANATVTVKINMQSVTIGSVTDQAKSSDFLDTERFPDAVFTSESFEKTADGYLAKGSLALHGVKLPLDLPFILNIVGDQAAMTAATTVNRIEFGVGAQGFPDEGSVAFAVAVDITLVANR